MELCVSVVLTQFPAAKLLITDKLYVVYETKMVTNTFRPVDESIPLAPNVYVQNIGPNCLIIKRKVIHYNYEP